MSKIGCLFKKKTYRRSLSENDLDKLFKDESRFYVCRVDHGSYGIVKSGIYKIDPSNSIKVAIKTCILNNKEDIASFENEVNTLNLCREHENIIKMYTEWQEEFFDIDGNLKGKGTIVLELCKYNFKTVLKDKKRFFISNQKKLSYAIQIATGIEYLHSHLGIVHRDIKPNNVLVSFKNKLKLCDFGSSKKAKNTNNSLYGTGAYLAPEVILSDDNELINPKLIDVYSFGIILWEIWSRDQPYDDLKSSHDYNKIFKIAKDKLKPDLKKISGAPEEYKQLVVECWDSDPNKRPQSFKLILKKLKEIKEKII